VIVFTMASPRPLPVAEPGVPAEGTGETALFAPELLSFISPYQRETALPARGPATQRKGRPAGLFVFVAKSF